MNALAEALHRAADEAPTRVDLPDAVGAAWREGRRRRTATRVGGAAAVLVALALVVGIVGAPVGGLPRAVVPAGEGRDGITAYPQRIGHQWWVRQLPERGGPLAGAVRVGGGPDPTWQAVGPTGTRYELPGTANSQVWPAVSPDGYRVAWLQADFGRWAIQDRRTGGSWFPQTVGDQPPPLRGERAPSRVHLMQQQSPAYFSADGRRLSMLTLDGPVVFDTTDGSERLVEGMDQPAGWLDDDRLVGRAVDQGEDAVSAERVAVVVWDRRTGVTSTLGTLSVPAPSGADTSRLNGQWWGSVRSDGTLWVSGSDQEYRPDGNVTVTPWLVGYEIPSLRPVALDGTPLAAPRRVELTEDTSWTFGVQWGGDVALTDVGGALVDAADPAGRPVVVVDDLVGASTSLWAQDALDAGPRWTPFGTSTWLVTWWWREIALVGAVVLAWRLWWRRRLGGRPLVRPRRATRAGGASGRSPGDR